jgi:uncharacterized RDD family membrane protein YckC
MFFIIGADGKEYGPVSITQIQEWMVGGRANLQTKARHTNETDWRTLGEFVEFGGTPVTPQTSEPLAISSLAGTQSEYAPTTTRPLAGRWLRLGAYLLDSIIGGFFVAPGFVVLVMAGVFTTPDHPNAALLVAGFIIAGTGALALLGIQIYLLVTRGQTLGKKFLGIRIVNFDDEGNPGFVKVFLLRVFVNGMIGAIPFVGIAYTLVDCCFIFREDKRCVHDLLAGTKVVVA